LDFQCFGFTAATTNITAIFALMMEAANTSEMSVNFYHTTQRNNPEDSHLHTRHCENLKSHILVGLHSVAI
jgi:hypothetical protein